MEKENSILIRTTSDILVAAAKIIDSTELCHSEVVQLARLAYYHRIQVDLWTKFDAKYPGLLTAIVVCTFGSACGPEVAVFFKNGDKCRKFGDEWTDEKMLEAMVQDCIYDYEIRNQSAQNTK